MLVISSQKVFTEIFKEAKEFDISDFWVIGGSDQRVSKGSLKTY